MGRRSLSADFSRLFSVLTSGDRVIFGVIGGFITGVIFAVTGAAVITTDTKVQSSQSLEFRAVKKGHVRGGRSWTWA
jgi:purine-cytosine permease-like protein